MKKKVIAKVLKTPKHGSSWHPQEAEELKKGVVVLVEAGDTIPARRRGDRRRRLGRRERDHRRIGARHPRSRRRLRRRSPAARGVLSDWLVVRVGVNPGESFLDRMIAMVEGARRQKTPNEIALNILLVALTIVFLVVVVTLLPMSLFSVDVAKAGTPVSVTTLVALLVCLIPTTIGALLSAIGVAGMSRMMQANVIATSGRAVEAAGDVDVLLMDKTGTITLGNRQASAFFAAPGVTEQQLADAAQLASLADETPEGRSITVLAKQKFNLRERDMASLGARFIAFTAQTRMSGVDLAARPRRRRGRSGRAPATRSGVTSKRSAARFRRARADDRGRGAPRQHAAGRQRRRACARRGRAQGHRQGRHQGALRRAAPHGHQDGDDHRRQPAHRRGDRRRGRRRRLPRRGHARGQAEADPRVPGRRPPGGDDRRRHQRRARAGPGRRRRRHEHRHAGGEGSRQHGRPRLEPDQAARGRRDRQAAADDARLADDLLDRQRRGEVLRHHPGGVRDDLSAARRARRDAPGEPGVGDPFGGDLQRHRHRLPHPARR